MRNYLKFYFMVFLFIILLLPLTVKGLTYEEFYDNLFNNNTFTIYSDGIDYNSATFENFVSNSITHGFTDDNGNSYHLNIVYNTCNYNTMKCDFKVYKQGVDTGKSYNNISIVVEDDVDSYFNFVKNDKITIKYDENFFDNETEKNNFINTYVYRFNTFKNGKLSNYYYYNKTLGIITYYKYENNGIIKHVNKKIDIVFDSTESEYSNDYKNVLYQTLNIKTDTDIDTSFIERVLLNKGYTKNNKYVGFRIIGKIKNNQAYISSYTYENNNCIDLETHKITINKIDIDEQIFKKVGLYNTLNIKSLTPLNTNDYLEKYLTYYINSFSNIFENLEYNYSSTIISNNNYIIANKIDKNGTIIDTQYHKITSNFIGYDNTISNKFSKYNKTEITINADQLNDYAVSGNINVNSTLLGCNTNYTYCDVGLIVDDKVEIHNIKIILNNSISQTFRNLFKLNDNNSLNILVGENISLPSNIHYYKYDPKTEYYYSFSCDFLGETCNLSLSNYYENYREEHTVTINKKTSIPTKYFTDNVYNELTIYPGINEYYKSSLNYAFSKITNESTIQSDNCDFDKGTCNVYAVNNDGLLEIQSSNINVKSGKSPEYQELFPNDNIKLNSIFINDEDYLYLVSSAYLESLTKTYSSLSEYNNGTAKIYFKNFESQNINVEFEEGNNEHKKIIDNLITKLDNVDLSVEVEDLEFVNDFYYNDITQGLTNYNSASLNKKIKSIVNDKNINYYYGAFGGMGSPLFEQSGGNIILYYDGIAYGKNQNEILFKKKNIIYIPDETEENETAYIKAAQKRIDEYLGRNSGITVSFDREANTGEVIDLNIDLNNFDGNIYKIEKSNGNDYKNIVIIKDSSKMQNPEFIATDVNNNVTVTSTNANYPKNTIVASKISNKLSDLNDESKEKLNVKEVEIVDIDLYSSIIGNIKNFNGTTFEVTVPIQNENLLNQELYAYYISDNGNIEEYPVTIEDGFAIFKTKHFSEYIIAPKINSNITNPKTYDRIYKYIITIILATIGLIISKKIFIKRKN